MRTLPNDSFGSVAVIYIVGNECRLSTLSRHFDETMLGMFRKRDFCGGH